MKMDSLDDLVLITWAGLKNGAISFDRTMPLAVLLTSGGEDAGVRTVVVKKVVPAKRLIFCTSDIRAEKIEHIRQNNRVKWLFYDPRLKAQIVAAGTAKIHHQNSTAALIWKDTPLPNRVHYCSAKAPGSTLECNSEVSSRSLTVAKSEKGFGNFAVIATTVDELEWMRLTPEGPIKAVFSWQAKKWKGRWVVA